MIRGYLVAISMLVLGLAGVVAIAAQASQTPTPNKGSTGAAAQTGEPGARVRPRPAMTPARVPPVRPVTAARPVATAPAMKPDAGAPAAVAVKPDASAPRVAPPRPAEPAPAGVLEFRLGHSNPDRKQRRAIRRLVARHGYKGVTYRLTPYAGERKTAKSNRSLAKRRCRKVARQIRKRGVSRRWIRCEKPVYRQQGGAPSAVHRSTPWRRVVIRVEKK